MKDPIDSRKFSALIVTKNGEPCPGLQSFLSEKGFSVKAAAASEALDRCRVEPPDLAIVQHDLGSTTGAQLLSRLLDVSWRTSSILITDLDEETLHERTEGLGILGGVSSPDDRQGLERLLETFFNLV